MEKIEKEICDLQKQITQIEAEKGDLVSKLEKRMSDLKEVKEHILLEKREKFVVKLDEFEKSPTDEKMEELLADLKQIKFSDIGGYEKQFKMVQKMQPLFKFIYEKQDVELVEKYLLAKKSLDAKDVRLFDKDIEKYKEHFKKDGYTCTKRSTYHMCPYCIYSYEIQELMFLLGKLDFYKKTSDEAGIYRSKLFEKYMLRAVVGVYGYWDHYVYADGEFGHRDYERKEFERLHDMAYQEEMVKLQECSKTSI